MNKKTNYEINSNDLSSKRRLLLDRETKLCKLCPKEWAKIVGNSIEIYLTWKRLSHFAKTVFVVCVVLLFCFELWQIVEMQTATNVISMNEREEEKKHNEKVNECYLFHYKCMNWIECVCVIVIARHKIHSSKIQLDAYSATVYNWIRRVNG